MITPITNSTITPAYNSAKMSFHGKSANVIKNPTEHTNCRNRLKTITFSALAISAVNFAAKLFNRKVEFNDSPSDGGIFLTIKKYKNNELQKVTNFSKTSFKPTSIDEYTNGKISKSTDFYSYTRQPHWLIEYLPDGIDIIREYKQNGKLNMLEYLNNDALVSIEYYDENGHYTRHEEYNPDETLASVITRDNNGVYEETYDHGVLKTRRKTIKNKDF